MEIVCIGTFVYCVLCVTDSSSDSKASSIDSGEFSRVPVKETPEITNLSLEDSTMEQLSTQLNSLSQMLQQVMERQNQQQEVINSLAQNRPKTFLSYLILQNIFRNSMAPENN